MEDILGSIEAIRCSPENLRGLRRVVERPLASLSHLGVHVRLPDIRRSSRASDHLRNARQ